MLTKMGARGGVLAVLSVVILSIFCIYNNVDADTASSTFSIDVSDTVLQLEVPATASINLNPVSSATVFGSTTITASVATNNALGYTLTMTPTNSASNTDLISSNVTSTIPTLSALDGGYTEQSFTTNSWGYRLASNENYFGVSTTLAPDAWIANGPTNGTDHDLTLAAKVDGLLPASDYSTTLKFEVVARMGPKDFDDVAPDCSTNPEKCDPNTNKVTMQYAAKGLCDIVDVYDSQYQVTDIRDHKTYWISKLKDGHCWMTQNLDYDMVANKTLYSTDTDIGWGTDTSTSWASATGTIPSSTIQNGIIMGWNQGDEYGPLSADIGTWYWTDNWYESANDNFLEGQITGNFAHSAFQGNTEHGHLGNYYNWSAANAVNDVVDGLSDNQTSICAAGWRLPRVGNDPVTTSGSNNEYARLFYVYAGANPSDDKAIVGAPLYLIRGGNIPEGGQKDTVLSAGNLGYYWTNSSTNRSGRNATMAFFSSYGSVGDGMGTLTRGYGIFVRCLAR